MGFGDSLYKYYIFISIITIYIDAIMFSQDDIINNVRPIAPSVLACVRASTFAITNTPRLAHPFPCHITLHHLHSILTFPLSLSPPPSRSPPSRSPSPPPPLLALLLPPPFSLSSFSLSFFPFPLSSFPSHTPVAVVRC